MKTPYFKNLTNDELRAEYKAYRNLAYNNAGMAASGAVNMGKAAAQMGHLMRCIQMMEGIAKQRHISLLGGK